MRVMLVNNVYPPIQAGGAELVVASLAEALAARGHAVRVVSTCGPEMEPYPDETRNGVEVVRFFPKNRYWSFARNERPRSGLDTARWHLKDAWNRDAGARLAAEIARFRPDVLHSHLVDGFSASVWAAAQAAGVRVVHSAHDYHLLCPRSVLVDKSGAVCSSRSLACRAYGAWHASTLRPVDVFTAPSRFVIEKHRDYLRLPADARVVANGVDLAAPAPRASEAVGLRLVILSRLTAEKGVDVAIRALGLLPGLEATLEIAGKGPEEANLRALAAADPRVRFLGYVSGAQKAALLARADALLLPSRWFEAFGLVILEAGAAGAGVIGSAIGAIPELVRPETTGLLIEPGSAESLAGAIARVAAEPALRAAFRAEGPKAAAAFSVEAMVEGYLAAYAGAAAAREHAATENAA